MDLLLDVNIVVDICAPREEFEEAARDALALCEQSGGLVWIYAGSVQTLEYSLYQELKRQYAAAGIQGNNRQVNCRARRLLQEFVKDKNWMAALAGEGPVFEAEDPEDEQLIQALKRFPHDSIRLLTRDDPIASKYPGQTFSPQGYLEYGRSASSLDNPAPHVRKPF